MPPLDWLKAAEKLPERQHVFLFTNFLSVKFHRAFENGTKDATGLSLGNAPARFIDIGEMPR